jgi:hypothetical protein
MAAQGELMGFGGAGSGGFQNDTRRDANLVGGQNLSAGTPTLEEMLNQATDLQTGRTFNGTRLELKSDEMTSPFQAPPPQMAPVPAATPSPMPMMGSQNFSNTQEQSIYPSAASNNYQPSQSYSTAPMSPGLGAPNGTELVRGADPGAKMEALKKWTVSTYKYTKQMVSEKMGRRTRTVDTEMEKHIQGLRETQARYAGLLKIAQTFTNQFKNIVATEKQLAEAFTELSLKSPDLQDEFNQNAALQKVVSKNGESLIAALTFFTENLQTLSTKTIDDTIMTIRDYESCRVEYDAYRTDLEACEAVGESSKTEEAKKTYLEQKERFESLRNNLQIKLRFLEENKAKVMRKQLLILHNSLAAYFSGNKEELEKTMKEFHVRVMSKGEGTSFLETH